QQEVAERGRKPNVGVGLEGCREHERDDRREHRAHEHERTILGRPAHGDLLDGMLAHTTILPYPGAPRRTGRCCERSARAPEACTLPSATARCHPMEPVASAIQVAGSTSTTLGGVPRV